MNFSFNKKKIKAFTLIEMILILIIMTIGWNIMFQMYKTFLDYMSDNQIYKNELVVLNNLNNLYSFTNNFFTSCTYQDDKTVKCVSKKTDNDFIISINKDNDTQKLEITDKANDITITLADIWIEQTVRKHSTMEMVALSDALAALKYKTSIWKTYYMIFPYN